jgi:site-specific recombinase XerD
MVNAGMNRRRTMKTTPLRQRTIDTLKLGHYCERTITTYIDWLIRLGEHYHRSPAELDNEQVQAFLLHLIEERKLAWSTVNQALSACRFLYEKVLYRPHAELRVPARRKVTYRACAYSKEQIAALLAEAQKGVSPPNSLFLIFPSKAPLITNKRSPCIAKRGHKRGQSA